MSTSSTPASSLIDLGSLAVRVQALEQEMAKLKQESFDDKSDWIEKIEGSFSDDPGYDEVIELGRQLRKADFS